MYFGGVSGKASFPFPLAAQGIGRYRRLRRLREKMRFPFEFLTFE